MRQEVHLLSHHMQVAVRLKVVKLKTAFKTREALFVCLSYS